MFANDFQGHFPPPVCALGQMSSLVRNTKPSLYLVIRPETFVFKLNLSNVRPLWAKLFQLLYS